MGREEGGEARGRRVWRVCEEEEEEEEEEEGGGGISIKVFRAQTSQREGLRITPRALGVIQDYPWGPKTVLKPRFSASRSQEKL